MLRKWMEALAAQQGTTRDRIQWTLAFELVIAALTPANESPVFLVKGGHALELRVPDLARATRDLDAMSADIVDVHEIEREVRARLAAPRCDGAVVFEVREAHLDEAVGFVRFDVRVRFLNDPLKKVKLEISAAEGAAGAQWDPVKAIGMAQTFGFTDGAIDEIPCLSIPYQIAQKIHAVTAPSQGNDRFRDLIDIILLDEIGDEDVSQLRRACVEIFTLRNQHPWPPTIEIRDGWEDGFRDMANHIAFPINDVHTAAAVVQGRVNAIAVA